MNSNHPWLPIARSAALITMVAWASPAAAQSAVFAPPALRTYVQEVLTRNAGLAAAATQVDAAGYRIAPAGALPDPMLTVGAMAVPVTSFDLDREPMTQFPVMVQQRFPFPGKQGAATAAARADSAVATAGRDATEAALVSDAVRAWWRLAGARTALAVWQRRVALADQAVTVAQARYQTGNAPQTDLLRARLRRAELTEERRQLEAGVSAAEARLNALRAGRDDPVQTPLLLAADSVRGVRTDTVPPDTVLRDGLATRSPALLAAAAGVERAERVARVFGVAGRPDFTVGLQAAPRLGGRETFLSALIGISIPLYGGRKQGPAADAARLDTQAASQRYDDLAARLRADVTAIASDLEALRARILQTQDEILPLADAASVSALQRYRVGALEFSAVLDAQDDLFRAQLRLARLMTDYGTAWGTLAALTGEEWYR